MINATVSKIRTGCAVIVFGLLLFPPLVMAQTEASCALDGNSFTKNSGKCTSYVCCKDNQGNVGWVTGIKKNHAQWCQRWDKGVPSDNCTFASMELNNNKTLIDLAKRRATAGGYNPDEVECRPTECDGE